MLNLSNREILPILEDFYKVTGIKFSLGDLYTGVMVRTGDFCEKMQSNINFHVACQKCDAQATENCTKKKEGYLYRCHAGFLEYITPIFYNGTIVAIATTGAITDGSEGELDAIRQNLSNYGLTDEEIDVAYKEVVNMDLDKVNSICNLLEACVSHFIYKDMLHIQFHDIAEQIESFISKNIAQNLNTQIICEHFDLSKSKLYEIFKDEFKTTVTDYVREKRMKLAKEMLRKGECTITEVANNVGYHDYSYFSKTFRKEYGISPREYRKNGGMVDEIKFEKKPMRQY